MLPATSLIPIRDRNPTRTFAWITAAIIALNVVSFLREPFLGAASPSDLRQACAVQEFFFRWGAIPREVVEGEQVEVDFRGCPQGTEVGDKRIYASVLSSMFLHGGLFHLLGNMLFLWVFGNNIEDRLGRVRFAIFYLVCGVAAAAAHIYTHSDSVTPVVGASGAVAGMLGAYVLLFPRARITAVLPLFFFWPVVELPALVVLGLWFVSQFLIGAGQQLGEAGVAWMAHVGGFLTGMALIIPFGGRRGEPRPFSQFGS